MTTLPTMPYEIKVDGLTAVGNGEELRFYTKHIAEEVYWRTAKQHPEKVVELYLNGKVEMAWMPDAAVEWVKLS